MQPELLIDARLDLGEGPAWDAQAGVLSFVDIRAGDLHFFNPATASHRTVNLGEPIGCAAPSSRGGLILGLRSGFAILDSPLLLGEGAGVRSLINPEPHLPGNRFNDGKCDPRGRFLAGTMDNAEKENTGSLYSYSPDGTFKTLLTGLGISNGLTWSPDHKTFYFIDTLTRVVMAYDYDLDTGDIANPRPAIHVPADMGWPDGMTSDMDGMLWVAMWGGAKLTKWNPATGQLVEAYPLPALNVSACCFGGANLTDLYVTSARKGMSAAQLEEYPHSGGLFRFQPGVRGMPTFVFDATVLK
jgi:sugar lactone lactonase YvrE